MLISTEHNWGFVPIEKCASRSLMNWLTGHGFDIDLPMSLCTHPEFADVLGDEDEVKRRAPGLPDVIRRVASGEVPIFAVCRNPFDRMVSTWFDVTHTTAHANGEIIADIGSREFPPFVDWLVNRLHPNSYHGRRTIYRTQCDCIGDVKVGHVIRFERLMDDLAALPFWDTDEPLEYAHRTNDIRHPWRHYCDDDTAEMIRRWAADDFARFGYPTTVAEEVTA